MRHRRPTTKSPRGPRGREPRNYLTWTNRGITDSSGVIHSLEHALELLRLGLADTRDHKLLDAVRKD